MKKINQKFIDALKCTGKNEQISLGNKLFLVMTPKGRKSYRFIFRRSSDNVIKKKNLGRADVLSFDSALGLAVKFNALLAQGLDPFENFKPVKKNVFTLFDIVEDWRTTRGARFRRKYLHDRLARFNKYLLAVLGNREITDISLFEARELIKQIYNKTPGIGERVAYDLRELGDHAVDMGLWNVNLLAPIKRSFPRPPTENNPCISADQLPDFLRTLSRSRLDLKTRLLIEFQLLTMVRAFEVVSAEWCDFDLDNAIWRIPAEKMKMKKPHDVPLCSHALEILQEIKAISGGCRFVFPHRIKEDAHCSSNTANQAFSRYLGYRNKMTPHGMRALARTWLADNGVDFFVAEACLAHVTGSPVSRVYNRSNYFSERIKAMQLWGDFVQNCKKL